MRPWLAGLTLAVAPLLKAGMDPARGVDKLLKAQMLAAGKPVDGLETAEQQIRFLADLPADVTARLSAGGGLLYDVVYGHWPTALATAWQAAGHPAVNGLGMLLQQAVRQIRIFATGEATDPLEREDAVVAVMRRAVMGD